jgi:hypothetical protein
MIVKWRSVERHEIISSKIAIGEKEENAVISQNLIGVVEGTDPI